MTVEPDHGESSDQKGWRTRHPADASQLTGTHAGMKPGGVGSARGVSGGSRRAHAPRLFDNERAQCIVLACLGRQSACSRFSLPVHLRKRPSSRQGIEVEQRIDADPVVGAVKAPVKVAHPQLQIPCLLFLHHRYRHVLALRRFSGSPTERLEMAVAQIRLGSSITPDQGFQYTSLAFGTCSIRIREFAGERPGLRHRQGRLERRGLDRDKQ